MKLEVVNGQVSFVGKMNELEKIEKALTVMMNELGMTDAMLYCNSVEDCDYCDIGFAYDMDEWRVEDIKWHWRNVKSSFNKKINEAA